MDKKQRLFLYITAAAAVLLTASAVFLGMFLQTRSLAGRELRMETDKLTAENEALKTRKGFLETDVNSKFDNSEQKDSLNKSITDITEKITKAKSELDDAKNELTSVKKKSTSEAAELNALKSGMNPQKGSYINADSTRLMCPAAIAEGRYIATGSGTFTVTSASGAARISESLSELETGSYTFSIESGEDIETHGEVTITALK